MSSQVAPALPTCHRSTPLAMPPEVRSQLSRLRLAPAGGPAARRAQLAALGLHWTCSAQGTPGSGLTLISCLQGAWRGQLQQHQIRPGAALLQGAHTPVQDGLLHCTLRLQQAVGSAAMLQQHQAMLGTQGGNGFSHDVQHSSTWGQAAAVHNSSAHNTGNHTQASCACHRHANIMVFCKVQH